jgi:hypothetical protein
MMKTIPRLIALAALVFGLTVILASSSVVLSDGQVIKGTDIRRDGDSYYVSLADGNTAVFPASLVKEIRIEDDAPPAPPSTQLAGPVVTPPGPDNGPPTQLAGPVVATPGTTAAKPTQLAGPVVTAPNPADQLKVFGPPTKWSKDAVDTTYVPKNVYDPNADVMANSRSTWSKNAVDTEWKPTNAYDPNADVMANSKSTWSKSAVDTTWQPQDGFGFKKLSFKGATEQPFDIATNAPPPSSPYGEPPAPAAPQGPAPWTCAEKLFVKDADKPATDKDNRAASLKVKPLKSPLYASLGLPLYEAEAGTGAGAYKAVFTIAGGACRLVGGDTDTILGLNLTPDHAMAQDGAAFNTAMAARGGAKVPAGVDKLDYAFALVSLTDPQVTGVRAATLTLIAKPEDLASIAGKSPAACALSKGKRRKQDRAASAAYATPKIAAGKEGDVVTFLSWSSAGGNVYRNTVVLSHGGVVSADRTVVASHVGAHTD